MRLVAKFLSVNMAKTSASYVNILNACILFIESHNYSITAILWFQFIIIIIITQRLTRHVSVIRMTNRIFRQLPKHEQRELARLLRKHGELFPLFLNKVYIQTGSSLAASAAADEAQDNQENVDDVQIELECSKDVLLRAELVATLLTADHHLGVKDEELQQHSGHHHITHEQSRTSYF